MGPDGVPIDDHANSDDEAEYKKGAIPGAKRGDDGSRTSRVEVLTYQVAFCSTGREWAAVSGEGWLQIYSLEESLVFDPIDFSQEISPATVFWHLSLSQYGLALGTALALNEVSLIAQVLDGIPFSSISAVARHVNPEYFPPLLSTLADQVSASPHVEFYLEWTLQLLMQQGLVVERHHRSRFLRSLRTLYKEIAKRYEDLQAVSNSNRFVLAFLEDHSKLMAALESDQQGTALLTDQ